MRRFGMIHWLQMTQVLPELKGSDRKQLLEVQHWEEMYCIGGFKRPWHEKRETIQMRK